MVPIEWELGSGGQFEPFVGLRMDFGENTRPQESPLERLLDSARSDVAHH